ncbi:MAG TPA: hypothetical protein VK474_10920 [Chthoniobacterales bacterium]|nr:hypothetical protein [Chthoniobacterales bacterium]
MRKLTCLFLLGALAFSGCGSLSKKKKKPAAETKKEASKPAEESSDVDFQAFLGRLRQAVQARDANVVAGMMTADFGYVVGATPDGDRKGEGVFQYWEEKGLWPELEGILTETFVKKDEFMVAPPQFANPAVQYTGYRAGIRRVNGSWKFVYFVNG